MTLRTRIAVLVGVLVVVAAMAAEVGDVSLYCSQYRSTTSSSEFRRPKHGDLGASVSIDRPIGRWLPFVKFGKTIYHHTYQYAQDDKTVLERDSMTQTRLVVIGLCSTRAYDELADAPFREVDRKSKKDEIQPIVAARGQ